MYSHAYLINIEKYTEWDWGNLGLKWACFTMKKVPLRCVWNYWRFFSFQIHRISFCYRKHAADLNFEVWIFFAMFYFPQFSVLFLPVAWKLGSIRKMQHLFHREYWQFKRWSLKTFYSCDWIFWVSQQKTSNNAQGNLKWIVPPSAHVTKHRPILEDGNVKQFPSKRNLKVVNPYFLHWNHSRKNGKVHLVLFSVYTSICLQYFSFLVSIWEPLPILAQRNLQQNPSKVELPLLAK